MNPDYFSLRTALQAVWNGSEYFEEDHKRLVVSAIPGLSAATFPESEQQLDQLQVAIVASQFLRTPCAIRGQHEFPFANSSRVMGKAMTQLARFSFLLCLRLSG